MRKHALEADIVFILHSLQIPHYSVSLALFFFVFLNARAPDRRIMSSFLLGVLQKKVKLELNESE